MRIKIFCETPPNVFSGGRYHAFLLAEAAAYAGLDAEIITNAAPVFWSDLSRCPAHEKIRLTVNEEFRSADIDDQFDAAIVVPSRRDNPLFYTSARAAARKGGAQLFLLNFESGNWFNALSPERRDLADWAHWKRLCRDGATVLSSAHESDRWARKFYNVNKHATRFAVWSPPINSAAADAALDADKENRLVVITRKARHKGFDAIDALLCEDLTGWTVTILAGRADIDGDVARKLRASCARRGAVLDLRFGVSDIEKFSLLKRAKILLFPSMFEGYGYPPIEALYCDCDVVAYDLPVLRETCGDAPYYARHGDENALAAALQKAVRDPDAGARNRRAAVNDLAGIEGASARLVEMLQIETGADNRTSFRNTLSPPIIRKRMKRRDVAAGFWAAQGARLSMLTTRDGRRHVAQRVLQRGAMAFQRTVGAPSHKEVSAAWVDRLGVVVIRGWRLGAVKADAAKAYVGDGMEIPIEINLARPGLRLKRPGAGAENAGFEARARLPGPDLAGEKFCIRFFAAGGEIDCVDGVLKRAGSAPYRALHSATRPSGAPKAVLFADADAVKYAGEGRLYVRALARAFAAAGVELISILRVNPADVAGSEDMFAPLGDQVILADLAAPSSDAPLPEPGSLWIPAMKEVYEAAFDGDAPCVAVAFGLSMSAGLRHVAPSARRLIYVFESDARGRWEKLKGATQRFDQADEVILAEGAEDVGPDARKSLLPSDAFGAPLPPSRETRRIVIPVMRAGANAPAIVDFARGLAETAPGASVMLAGPAAAMAKRQYEALAAHERPDVVFDCIGPVESLRAILASAQLCAVPAPAPEIALAGAALGRASAALAAPRGMAEAMLLAPTPFELGRCAGVLIADPAAVSDLEKKGFAHAALARRPGATNAWLRAACRPRMEPIAGCDDFESAAQALVQAHDDVRQLQTCRVLASHNLSVLRGVLKGLAALGCSMESVHVLDQRDHNVIGDAFENVVAGSPEPNGAPVVIAALDRQSIADLASRLDERARALRLASVAMAQDDRALLARLDRWALDAPQILLADDDMVRSGVLPAPGECVVIARNGGEIDWALGLDRSDLTIIASEEAAAPHGGADYDGALIRIDPRDPPWPAHDGEAGPDDWAGALATMIRRWRR